jgi:hypothetical protein
MKPTKPETSIAQRYDLSRRALLRRTAAGGTALTVGASVDGGPVQDADALAASTTAALIVAGVAVSAAVGWALREYEVIGKDDPPTGLTPGSLKEQSKQTARTRKSTNASTFIDNRNIIKGVNNAAFADGKVAAVEALNDGKSKSAVKTDAQNAVDEYQSTIVRNLLKSWNESVREIVSMSNTVQGHPDVTHQFFYEMNAKDGESDGPEKMSQVTSKYTLANGNEFDLLRLKPNVGQDYDIPWWSPVDRSGPAAPTPKSITVGAGSDDEVTYLKYDEWNTLVNDIQSDYQSVRDGLILWVDTVYSQVQSGELDVDDLLTPRELSQMSAGDSDFNQAVADLAALNLSANADVEAKVTFPDLNGTFRGNLFYTGSGTLSTGTIQPSTDGEDYFFSYDSSEISGSWTEYQSGIDGGVLTFTDNPWPGLVFTVETEAGETVTVKSGEFTEESGNWTVDLSDELETTITTVSTISFGSQRSETSYQTVRLTDPFEIQTFITRDGGEKDQAEYSRSEPHTDDNYITEEEWKQQQQRYENLIEEYKQAKAAGGFNFDQFGFAGYSGEVVVMVAGAILVVLGISN